MIWRAGLVAFVLGLAGGLVGVWAGLQLSGGQVPPDGSLHQFVHHDLDLSSEQEAQIEALEAEFTRRRQVLEDDMAEARHELGVALMQTGHMTPEVEAQARAFHEAMGRLQIETLNHIVDMRETLTPEQRERFDARLTQALDAGN
ncbi:MULTISPECIES: periplasmic heavy metal sensor [Hyphobacterium]|uniref:Spy/CpxP family protein refolding chaperone n=1 Tax=Hyphobacterium vulgare TaxID=1736751 RepID=A0ABV6ZW83_9PROT|nr:periplasmic heavy metal sensor [Alphaproteobacteria bacterium]MCF8881001.1 periplasmic heavy metal sensor [Hyphobacterium sp. SN044]